MTRWYMLDTNTVSYIVKGTSAAARGRLSALKDTEAACISAITEAELWYGLERVGSGERRRNALRQFLRRMKVLSWDSDETEVYGAFRARQEAIGLPLGPLDTLIAAHAISAGAVLVSSDAAFAHAVGLPGLEVWATDLKSSS